MVDSRRDTERTRDGLTRRTALRSIAGVGLAGTALTGTASADGSGRITFRAGDDGALNFQLVVTGRIRTSEGVVAGSDVQVAHNVAQGTVADGERRRFAFTGEVSVLQVTGPGEVVLNGEVVRDTTSGDDGAKQKNDDAGEPDDDDGEGSDDDADDTDAEGSSDGSERLPKRVVVSSTVDAQRNYVFEVTGDLQDLKPDEDSGNAREEIVRTGDRVRVEGTVGTGTDEFAFSGEFVPVEKPPEVNFDVRDR